MRWFTKICDVDVAPIQRDLDAHPELWDSIVLRKIGPDTPHREMQDIWVRYNDLAKFPEGDYRGLNDAHVPIWYPAWHKLPSLRPIIFDLMARVQGEMLGGVLITRILPGGKIAPHVDTGWHVRYYSKYYVSVKSAPGATFHCGDEALNPKTGEVWLFDNKIEHWVENNSAEDRVTLIVCIRTEIS